MEKRGYKRGTEKSGSSYVLVFSENSDWVTLKRKAYGSDRYAVMEDSGWFSEGLQTACVSISLVDSDFATLELYTRSKVQTDFSVLGDASGYLGDREQPLGVRKYWEPFLKEGFTWEQFQNVLTGSYTFAEDGLDEMAPYLGMDMGCMGSDELSSGGDESNTIVLYFRKAARTPSLNTVFKQVFGEGLKEQGFVKIKGKQPYLVRMVGDEIIHVITCMDEWCGDRGFKEFIIYASVATVYRKKIDLTVKPEDIEFQFESLSSFYSKNSTAEDYDNEYRMKLYSFRYKEDDGQSLQSAMEQALEESIKFIIPVLDQAVTLPDSCLKFFRKFNLTNFYRPEYDVEQQTFSYTAYEDGLLLIHMKNQGHFQNGIPQAIADPLKVMESRLCSRPEIYEKTMAELKRRKEENQETLRSYGLEL